MTMVKKEAYDRGVAKAYKEAKASGKAQEEVNRKSRQWTRTTD